MTKEESEEEYNYRKKKLESRLEGMTLSKIAQIDNLDIPDELKGLLKQEEVVKNKKLKKRIKRRLDDEYKDENGEFYDSFFEDVESDGSAKSLSLTMNALSDCLDSISETVY